MTTYNICLQAQGISTERKDIPHLGELEKSRFLSQQQIDNGHSLPQQNQFDITSYRLDLDILPQSKQIRGSVRVEGQSRTDSLASLEINLFSNMSVISIVQNQTPIPFVHAGDLLQIPLLHPLGEGENFSVEIFYQGQPQRIDFGAFTWEEYQGKPRIWTLSEPYGAPAWWPCKDDPTDKADSVFINITVPNELTAASNGKLTGIIQASNSRNTFSWKTRYPISAYLICLAIADYTEFTDLYIASNGDSMPLTYYVYPELLEAAQKDFAATAEMLGAFSALFGEYPFIKEKYGIASVPRGASMEHQTLTSLNARHITGTRRDEHVLSHELAHHWFGDAITMQRWSDIWLNEGFASYCEALWEEHLHGKEVYHEYMNGLDPGYFEGSIFVDDTTDIQTLFSNTVYHKGAWVLHMLRGVLGDSVFFAALKNYALNPGLIYGNASTDDFRHVSENTARRDLTWFFEQWIYRPGRPVYEYHWEVTGEFAPFTTTLAIKQSNLQSNNNPYPYTMPLQIHLSGGGRDTMLTVWDSLAAQEFRFQTSFHPLELEIDPNNWVLKRLRKIEQGEFTGIPTQFKLSQNFPNPFNASTTIIYGVPSPTSVKIEIFNVLGKKVYSHRISRAITGFHHFTWDGQDHDGNDLPSGIYFYRFSDGQSALARKMILIR